MFSNHFTTNLSQNAAVKIFWKSVSNWPRYWQNFCGLLFLGHSVCLARYMLSLVSPSVSPSVCPSVRRADQSKTI